MNQTVLLQDTPAPSVARLLINRPAKRNAIDHAVRQAMVDALGRLEADRRVRAVVLGGVEGVFSAGGDVASMVGLSQAQARERMQHVHVLCRMLAGSRLPVVSAIEGIGAGAGVGISLLGDYIVVGPGTKILFPFLRLGLTPDWGQLFTLPRRIGLGPARRILSSGKPVNGEEAFALGLADALVPDADVMQHAIDRAAELARLPADAFARMKQRLSQPSASLGEELAREEGDQAVCLLSADFQEGYAAFTGKREPDFTRNGGAP